MTLLHVFSFLGIQNGGVIDLALKESLMLEAKEVVAVDGCNTMVGASVNGQRNSSNATANTSNTPASLPNLSAEQWQTIATMFGNAHSSTDRLHGEFSKISWIIDTGASNHVTGDESYLPHVPLGSPMAKK